MTSTIDEAYKEMMEVIRSGLLASVVTSSIPVDYDDREFEKPGEDASGLPLPFIRASIDHIGSERQCISSQPIWQETALATVQVFTPFNGGRELSNQILQVAQNFFRGISSGELSLVRVGPPERVGQDGPYFAVNLPCEFYFFQDSAQT